MLDRVLAGLDRSGGPDACWPWMNNCSPQGYGQIHYGGTTHGVHRVMLELTLGRPLGPRMQALHTWDNPPCANPRHLYEGTQAQNVADAMRRGRHVPPPRNGVPPPVHLGETNPRAILTEDTVRALRHDRDAGATYAALAVRYGVSKATVCQVVARRTWKEVV